MFKEFLQEHPEIIAEIKFQDPPDEEEFKLFGKELTRTEFKFDHINTGTEVHTSHDSVYLKIYNTNSVSSVYFRKPHSTILICTILSIYYPEGTDTTQFQFGQYLGYDKIEFGNIYSEPTALTYTPDCKVLTLPQYDIDLSTDEFVLQLFSLTNFTRRCTMDSGIITTAYEDMQFVKGLLQND